MLETQKDLAHYRILAAKERLDSAKLLMDNESYKDSIGRSYYSYLTRRK